jgi:hypothetical protein
VFKRLFWLSVGVTVGAGTSWWVTRAVKQKVEQYVPARVRQRAARRVRALGNDVRAAIADGRQAMHDQEEVLRARLDARYRHPDG